MLYVWLEYEIYILKVASAPQVLSPKRLRTTSATPPVISSQILSNNYLLATQPQGVATFPQHHHLTPYHHQHTSLLQAIQLPLAANSQSLTQIKSILTSSPASAAVTIPTQQQFISAVNQQQQQQKSINTSSTYNSQLSISAATKQHPVTAIQTPNINNPSILSSGNSTMENPTGQLTPMAHPLSQSMDSVNTASNEEEVSQI